MAGSLGSLVIELAANTARLQSDMGKAVGIAERSASKIKSAFTFVTAGVGGGLLGSALLGAAKNAIELGDNLNKAAIKAGVGGRDISELAYAAKLADVSLDSLSNSLKKMNVFVSEASTGGKEQLETLRALGLVYKDLKGMAPDRQFELIADRISQMTDPADRARAAVAVFGKAGADLLPLFEQGAVGIAKARVEAEKLGYAFGDDQLKALAETDDAVKRLSASWDAFGTILASKVSPYLTKTLDQISSGKAFDTFKSFTDSPIGYLYNKLTSNDAANDEYDRNRRGTIARPEDPKKAIGYAAADAAAKAKAASEAELKERKKADATYRAMVRDLNEDVGAEADKTLAADMDREMERLDAARETYATYMENEKMLAVYREAQSKKLSESAQIFKDAFLNAWDDMVNTGKFKWDELLKYLVAEFARRGIVKLFDSIFAGKSSSNAGGVIVGVGSAIVGAFGGGKASGGDVSGSKSYLIGERGPEIFMPGRHGSIVPNGALGGTQVSIVQNIDARGATMDLAKALPRILKQHGEQVKSELIEGLRRQRYAL